ncbi:Calvin cycle protein CP12 [Leptolyngbya sp. FACHB-17]|uniref:Calvin cycle protein CP12 n=1 Tax=unclassified Leptolyngbya TaxID=2650499 RepID=UPI00168035E4|nr:Calvin cycle protein CP12 [Leptolyngbya sp. FACHB-17]MBD2079385.1 Calvin cycle protein CP12 [Leptolyngbya sp. FACHB-17]
MTEAKEGITIKQRLTKLVDQARDACGTNGTMSDECATAWDAVEEVQAEISHRRLDGKGSLAAYCDDNPDAAECRIYDV